MRAAVAARFEAEAARYVAEEESVQGPEQEAGTVGRRA
jgi:hypothetical protein